MTILANITAAEEKGHPVMAGIAHVLVPVGLALLTTVALVYLMQSLITSSRVNLDTSGNIHLVDFVRIDESQEVRVKERKPKKPPEPEELPPPEASPQFNVAVNDASWGMSNVQLEDTSVSNAFSFVSDGNYLPIVKVQPVYPRNALVKGMEGWVVVGFTVDQQGRVVDPEVLENCAHPISEAQAGTGVECWDRPNPIFDKAALRAAAKFKYKPKVVDGVPVETPHVRNKITFQLAKE